MSVEFEKQNWNNYYAEVLNGEQQDETSLWWHIADRDAVNLIKQLFKDSRSINVLEPGCGSGSTSIYLSSFVEIKELVLLDISINALKVAQNQVEKHLAEKVKFIEGDIFNLSVLQQKFDLVWNIGLIEHYQENEIRQIISQMYSILALEGYLVIGIPNRQSIAVQKAALLGSKLGIQYLNWVKGYRNTSEILYSNESIKNLIKMVTHEQVEIHYGGNLLWVGAPDWLIRFTDKYFKSSSFSFLSFFVLKKTN